MSKKPEPVLKINPYVTSKGGVVILNGPFPIDEAWKIARLCKAAPKLLAAAKLALEQCPFPVGAVKAKAALQDAITAAEGDL